MHEEIERLRHSLARELVGLSSQQMQTRRAEGKWTIQQIVEHLSMSYRATTMAIGARTAKGTPTKARPTLAQRFGQCMIIDFGLFPAGRQAPAAVSPGEDIPAVSGDVAFTLVEETLDQMDRVLNEAEGLFGSYSRSVSHVVLGPMSIRQWRRFHLVHGDHHIKQIKATRRADGFSRD